jgi:hypothetical protein
VTGRASQRSSLSVNDEGANVNDTNDSYRMLHFLVSHGDRVAIVVAIATLALGVGVWLTGASVWFAVLGVLGAAFMYLIMRSYVELVRVIVDMLLPK